MSDDPGPSSVPKLCLTKPAENYCRLCQLIMTVCSDLFRDILSHHIQPANLRGELDKHKNTLLRALKIPNHKKLLFPQSGGQSLSAKDMDLTILYTLLRNICGIPSHQNGWGNTPNTGDITLAACIERIREQKNAIASHSNIGEIDDICFQDIWMKLQTDIVKIENELIGGDMYERAVKVLLSCELTPKKAQESAGVFSRLYGIKDVFCCNLVFFFCKRNSSKTDIFIFFVFKQIALHSQYELRNIICRNSQQSFNVFWDYMNFNKNKI